MSIQSEITRLEGAKSDISDAIEDKGVTVPSGTTLDGFANLIAQIPTGGGSTINIISGFVIDSSAWVYDSTNQYWSQSIASQLSNDVVVTENTKFDIQPNSAAIIHMLNAGTAAMFIINDTVSGGSADLTLYAIGGVPSVNVTVQITYYETA